MERKKFEMYFEARYTSESNKMELLDCTNISTIENVSMYLKNSLNALFAYDVLAKDYTFLQDLSDVFGPPHSVKPEVEAGFNRTTITEFQNVLLFEIVSYYVNEIVKNPLKGYEVLDKIYGSKYPLFHNADKMKDDELYLAYEKSIKIKNDPLPSIYGAICCCMFLEPNLSDMRWQQFLSRQVCIHKAGTVKTAQKKIEDIWEIENIKESKRFARFMKKRREDLEDYIRCEESQLHISLLVMIFAHLDKRIQSSFPPHIQELCKFSEKQFEIMEEVCKNNLIGFHWLIYYNDFQLNDIMNECINQSLYKLAWSIIEEKLNMKEEFTISMLVHNVLIENPGEFLKEIITTFFFSLSSRLINKSVEYSCDNFSLEKFLKSDSTSILNNKISELEAVIQEKDNMLKNQKQEIDALNSRIQRLENQLSNVVKAQASETEKKLREIRNENDQLREKLAIYEEFDELQGIENEDYLDCEDEVDITAISGKRMLFIGGRNEVVQKLKASFPNAVFVQNEIRRISFCNFERVIIFSRNMNHPMYYKYRNLIRREGLKVVFCNTNNMEQVYRQFFMSFQEAA